MKKRIVFIISLLLLTGCTCEYNLNISDDNIYTENIDIISSNTEEKNELNREWKIPININEYNLEGDTENNSQINTNEYDYDKKYNYKINNNILNLNYKFSENNFSSSTAANRCFSKVTITKYNGNILISTSSNFLCFDDFRGLTSLKINITTNKKVISNNADNVNKNTYTWTITKNNIKPINMIINNSESSNSNTIILPEENNDNPEINNQNTSIIKKENSKNLMLIFLSVIVLIVLIGYLLFNKFKDKNSRLDD